MELSKDFEEFFGLLNSYKARYLVVGGYAFAVHGRPRYTGDIDIFLDSSEVNARKIIRVLDEFGFGGADITVRDLTKPDRVIQLGNPPYRIDLLTSISGVTFSQAWKNRVSGKYGKQIVHFIGKADLIKNKRATGRQKDLLDLDDLE